MKKKVLVRWTAVYETVVEIPEWASVDHREAHDAATRIPIDVKGSTVQSDTWEIESIKDIPKEEVEA